MAVCARCGEQIPDRARFCSSCGAPLVETDSVRETRKTVTILFCDVVGSTAMGESLDPEATRGVMTQWFEAMSSVITAHGGTVEKFIGDAIMAVFGIPVVHEDDALRAIRAASDMRAVLVVLNERLQRDWAVTIRIRTGIATGEVVAGAGDQTMATGDAVNTAARLEQHARPGEILFAESTYRMVRNAVSAETLDAIEVKGKAEPLRVHRLREVYDTERDGENRLDSPLVGRANELQLIEDAFHRAMRAGTTSLFTIFGSPGVGKSRLTRELLMKLENRATISRGHCLPYGRGITFWPLGEIVRDVARLSDDETPADAQQKIAKLVEPDPDADLIAERVAGLIGLGDASSIADEAFWAVRKLFEALARRNPLVVVFDDIHWAEPTLLDLIEHIADWVLDVPILLLCIARPELLETRPSWGGGKLNATSIRLEPLRNDESEALIGNLLGGFDLPAEILRRITSAAGGTPLFVEEMIGMLVDEKYLERTDGKWKVAPGIVDFPVPPSISALLAARLDRLDPHERHALERAAVVGTEFSLAAITVLAADGDQERARAALSSLVRKDVVRPDRSRSGADERFQFRHVLIRNTAYNAIPKHERARLHEAYAQWLIDRFPDHIPEHEELIGYHFEQAFQARMELGPADAATKTLARRASAALAASGRRALTRGDEKASSQLLDRARALIGDEVPARLVFDLGRSVRSSDAIRSKMLFAQAIEAAQKEGDLPLEELARVEMMHAHVQTVSGIDVVPEGKRVALKAIKVLEQAHDDEGCASAWTMLADCHNSVGEHLQMLDAAERAIEYARRAGDERNEYFATRMVVSAMTWGPVPVADALARAERLQASAKSPLQKAAAAGAMGYALAHLGKFEDAHLLALQAMDLYSQLGMTLPLATLGCGMGWWNLLAEQYAEAEQVLRESCDRLERVGEIGLLSTFISTFGEALFDLGRLDEAEQCSVRGEQLGTLDDLATQIAWRSLRARVFARKGKLEEAIHLARDAAAMTEKTQGLLWQANAALALAEVLEQAGDLPSAIAEARNALERLERKGVVPLINRTRNQIKRLEAAG